MADQKDVDKARNEVDKLRQEVSDLEADIASEQRSGEADLALARLNREKEALLARRDALKGTKAALKKETPRTLEQVQNAGEPQLTEDDKSGKEK